MEDKNMRFGDYIKRKRLQAKLTHSNVAEALGCSRSHLCDIEKKRKMPFDGEKLELFAALLNLTEEETALLYDLASREKRGVPYDLEDILMYETVGELARTALRQTKAGNATEADWKRFIREIQENKIKRDNESMEGSGDG